MLTLHAFFLLAYSILRNEPDQSPSFLHSSSYRARDQPGSVLSISSPSTTPARAPRDLRFVLPRFAAQSTKALCILSPHLPTDLLILLHLIRPPVKLFRNLIPTVVEFLEAHSPLSSRCSTFDSNTNTATMGRKFFVGGNFKM